MPVENHQMLDRRYRGEHPFHTLLYLFQGDYWKLIKAVAYYIVKHSGVWAMPLITASIVDVVTQPDRHPLSDLWMYIGILVIILLLNVPTHYLYIRCVSTATRNMETRLRAAIARRLQQLSMPFYTQRSTGVLQTKLLRDVEVIQQVMMQLFQVVPSAGITLVFAISVTAVRAPIFLIFYLIAVPISVLLNKYLRKSIQERNRDFRHEVEDMSSTLIEMINLIPITRAHGIENHELRRVERKLDNVRTAGLRLDTINAIFGALAWVAFRLTELLCLSLSAYAAYKHLFSITVGDMIMLTGFFNNLTQAVLMILNMLPEITRGFEFYLFHWRSVRVPRSGTE